MINNRSRDFVCCEKLSVSYVFMKTGRLGLLIAVFGIKNGGRLIIGLTDTVLVNEDPLSISPQKNDILITRA